MIEFHSETLIPLTEAARSLPVPCHVSTLHRWHLRGVRGIKLETTVVGGRRFTTVEALKRFRAATNAVADGRQTDERTSSNCGETKPQLHRIFER